MTALVAVHCLGSTARQGERDSQPAAHAQGCVPIEKASRREAYLLSLSVGPPVDEIHIIRMCLYHSVCPAVGVSVGSQQMMTTSIAWELSSDRRASRLTGMGLLAGSAR